MPNALPRSIAVIDVGSTNAKAVHVAPDLSVLDERVLPVEPRPAPPYLHLDPEPILDFALAAIRAFDAVCPVDAVVPCSHGSSLALLDGDGALALPIMSYSAQVPDAVAADYAEIEPEFDEVLAPTNPGALTLGRQLLWQETVFPEAFARVRQILPYAQYVAFRLCGVAANEVSALGAQTHLWAPKERAYSSLAKARGWDQLMAPVRGAAEVLGRLDLPGMQGRGDVFCGVHDSNANFLRFAGLRPLVLLSTGTWIIAFDSGAPLDALDGARDQVSNTTVFGDPIGCARFMGGAEYARITGDRTAAPEMDHIARLVATRTMALPSFTDSGGPVPGTGGQGRVVGPPPRDDADRASLATLYTAQMTALALDGLGRTERVVIDGPFAGNPVFPSLLAALMPDRAVALAPDSGGTAIGAAILALPGEVPAPRLVPVPAAELPGLTAYHAGWRQALTGY